MSEGTLVFGTNHYYDTNRWNGLTWDSLGKFCVTRHTVAGFYFQNPATLRREYVEEITIWIRYIHNAQIFITHDLGAWPLNDPYESAWRSLEERRVYAGKILGMYGDTGAAEGEHSHIDVWVTAEDITNGRAEKHGFSQHASGDVFNIAKRVWPIYTSWARTNNNLSRDSNGMFYTDPARERQEWPGLRVNCPWPNMLPNTHFEYEFEPVPCLYNVDPTVFFERMGVNAGQNLPSRYSREFYDPFDRDESLSQQEALTQSGILRNIGMGIRDGRITTYYG
jgi:hypothetical protein